MCRIYFAGVVNADPNIPVQHTGRGYCIRQQRGYGLSGIRLRRVRLETGLGVPLLLQEEDAASARGY